MYEELLEKIEQNKFKEIQPILVEMHVQDIADLLEKINNPRSPSTNSCVKENFFFFFMFYPKNIKNI